MSRIDAFVHTVDAMARIQGNIALVLEAKAVEAEKNKEWLRAFVQNGAFSDVKDQYQQSLHVHEALLSVIDGIVKMESAMARNLRIVMNKVESDSGSGSSMFGDLFGSGDDPR